MCQMRRLNRDFEDGALGNLGTGLQILIMIFKIFFFFLKRWGFDPPPQNSLKLRPQNPYLAVSFGKMEGKEMKMDKNKNFEEQIEKLENIVKELEKGDLNLDDSVAKFEEGIKISKECNEILEKAEKKISILVNQDGEIKEENFETEE